MNVGGHPSSLSETAHIETTVVNNIHSPIKCEPVQQHQQMSHQQPESYVASENIVATPTPAAALSSTPIKSEVLQQNPMAPPPPPIASPPPMASLKPPTAAQQSTSNPPPVTVENFSEDDKKMMEIIFQFMKKKNLNSSLESFKQEANFKTDGKSSTSDSFNMSSAEVNSLLSAYSSEANPNSYEDNYRMLRQFVDASLDAHKWELAQLLYPVFIHMYLELVYNNHKEKSSFFFKNFGNELESYHKEDLLKLSEVNSKLGMEANSFVFEIRSNKYVVRLSADSHSLLKQQLQDKNMPIVQNVIQRYLTLDPFEGRPRTKQQIEAISGGLCGEARSDENKAKVYYGLFKEPDIDIPLEENEDGSHNHGDDETSRPPSKKKKKKEFVSKKNKADPNAPLFNRIPLPEPKDADIAEQMACAKESLKRTRLGAGQSPSVMCYTLTNSYGGVTCVRVCDDSSLLACGFRDSTIKVWTLTPRKLMQVRSVHDLHQLDKESDKVLEDMMNDRDEHESRTLLGHQGIVYSVSFSPCRTMLVSSSEDGTVRLWSLLTWSNLMSYKGHLWPVWDCQFSPFGHYMVSCGQDRLARLWVTDHFQPVRIFAGHMSDVDCVCFHHNCNYIATGSSDRVVRVWDVLSGNSVRVFTGHKKQVLCLAWSPCGRYLASGGADGQLLVWDMQTRSMVARFNRHVGPIYTICFSRDGEVLASGGADDSVKIWEFQQAVISGGEAGSSVASRNITANHHPVISDDDNYLLSDFPTKSTPIAHLHFTRRNLLIAVGLFEHS